jgi:1,4-dihydroxy-2-naphthoyl-CoA hydrolase
MQDLIAFEDINLDKLNEFGRGTLSDTLGMLVEEVGPDYIVMSMPVESKVLQPLGLLHGGAVAALAENAGSLAASLVVGHEKAAVGLSIYCNHLKGVRSGQVRAKAQAVHIGRTTHVWSIQTHNDQGELINDCRLTMAIIQKK